MNSREYINQITGQNQRRTLFKIDYTMEIWPNKRKYAWPGT